MAKASGERKAERETSIWLAMLDGALDAAASRAGVCIDLDDVSFRPSTKPEEATLLLILLAGTAELILNARGAMLEVYVSTPASGGSVPVGYLRWHAGIDNESRAVALIADALCVIAHEVRELQLAAARFLQLESGARI